MQRAESELTGIQSEIDNLAFDLYDIHGADRQAMLETASTGEDADAGADENDEEAEAVAQADTTELTAQLLSYGVGLAFERFNLDLATGQRPLPPEPEPFDPLPARSPGMVQGESAHSGILIDDPGHSADFMAAIQKKLETVQLAQGSDPTGDSGLEEAGAILGSNATTWLRKNFFELHIKRYSKSRRKAPIYWQLATPSASYSVWLYYHRLNRDTFYRVLNDYIMPKLQHEERKLNQRRVEGGANPTISQRNDIAAQEGFVEELKTFRDEVARIAPLWNPDLNDGVIINFALLWRLVPQHRTWQKECKACWDKLVAGDIASSNAAWWSGTTRAANSNPTSPNCREENHLPAVW